MTEPRIDTLAKAFARGLSRRRLTGIVGAGAIAAVGLAARPKSALVCQRVGTPCRTELDCCDGATCRDDTCACGDGWRLCDATGRCVNPTTDEAHCGRCGNACAAGETCCAGTCVDAERNRDACGGCGTACSGDELCVRGTCLRCPLATLPCGDVCCARGRCDDGRCPLA